MNISVQVDDHGSRHDFAPSRVVFPHGTAEVHIDFERLSNAFGEPLPTSLDLIHLAAVVYTADRWIERGQADDRWTRQIHVSMPVSDPALWNTVQTQLEDALSFLTGDAWSLTFSPLNAPLIRPNPKRRNRLNVESVRAVSLFSGGLDSLVGAINRISSETGRVLLVGHHDQSMKGPKKDQATLTRKLQLRFRSRFTHVPIRVNPVPSGRETSLRARSLLFLSLGLYVAVNMGEDIPLLVPENGTISFNTPLTPSRRGSCSTRTTHPAFLQKLRRILPQLGIATPIENPLGQLSKGQVVEQCRDLALLKKLSRHTVSCGKRGHKRHWLRKNVSACGHCMPCIYRRASLHRIGADTERYGRDICRGEVDVSSKSERHVADLRAIATFVRRSPSKNEIARQLVAGGLPASDALESADVVLETLCEIRKLIMAKGTTQVRRWFGV
jgi:7-cyano-7-deazaguanine synthase in queuosine biosynthesis